MNIGNYKDFFLGKIKLFLSDYTLNILLKNENKIILRNAARRNN